MSTDNQPPTSGEQLAADDPAPRGEDRDSDTAFLLGGSASRGDGLTIDRQDAPSSIDEHWQSYYVEFALTRAALSIFDDLVTEPGYQIKATQDDETDEEMTDALNKWANNCVIHAGEWGTDLSVLLNQLPSRRRGKGTVFIEKVGTEQDPDAMAALLLLDPSTMSIHTRDDQNVLVQPDDEVGSDAPRTPDGDAAAYVQYESETRFRDTDAIPFARGDIIKLVYDAEEGSAWGTSIFDAIGSRIDSFRRKLDDRDVAIKQVGYGHRIYSSETWSLEEAKEYKKAHREGDVSSWEDPDSQGTWAGRVDFANDALNVDVIEGSVPDIMDAIMDDIQSIFAMLPVARFKIAYEEDINQFVVEPQQETDDRKVDKERNYIERKLGPVFETKADELADGEYSGEVSFTIEQPKDENPLRRSDFPAANLEVLGGFISDVVSSGATADVPLEGLLDLAGVDVDELAEEFGFEPDQLQDLPTSSDAFQRQDEAISEQNASETVESD